MTNTTPPWEVGPWDLRSDLEKITQQWTPVHEILADGDLYELRAPDVSAWSCGEEAGHILLVAQEMVAQIEASLADPARNRDGAWTEHTGAVLEGGRFPRGRAQSPAPFIPVGRPRDEFVALYPEVEHAWEALARREEELRDCPARGRHVFFGFLTCAEWVRACAVHTAHHLAVVRDIRGVSPPVESPERD